MTATILVDKDGGRMFNHVVCDVPLPDGYAGEAFQTRDFGCDFSTYAIRPDGRLEVTRVWMGAASSWEPAAFQGTLRFYGYDDSPSAPPVSDRAGRWHEYLARFDGGTLVEIARVEGALPS